jgi:hypothetical protein
MTAAAWRALPILEDDSEIGRSKAITTTPMVAND